MLAIFDCCYASNAHKGFAEDRRIYELLAASPRGYTTPGPGPNSFTNRLITSLRELLEEHQDGSFTTTKLLDRINNKRKTPSTGASPPAMLHDRLSKFHHRHIQLARLDGQVAEQKQWVLDQQPQPEAYLELRFSLQNASMKHDQIEALARELPGAFNNANIQLCNIDWTRFQRRHHPTWPGIVTAANMAIIWRRKSRQSYRTNPNSPMSSSGDAEPVSLQHITSRDDVASPYSLSTNFPIDDETAPLLNPKRPARHDRHTAPPRNWRNLLRVIRHKIIAALARLRGVRK